LTKHFQTVSFKGFGIADLKGLLRQEPFCTTCPKHNTIGTTYDSTYLKMRMDGSIYDSNLELYHSYNPNAVTLLDVIDKRFRQWWSFIKTLVGTLKKTVIKYEAVMRLFPIYKKTRKCCKKCQIKQIRFRAAHF
jgi:hypothetical protein